MSESIRNPDITHIGAIQGIRTDVWSSGANQPIRVRVTHPSGVTAERIGDRRRLLVLECYEEIAAQLYKTPET